MRGFTERLWPESVSYPIPRLLAGIVLAPVVATVVVAAVAFIIAGFTEATQIGVMAVTENAAITFLALAVTLTLTAVIPGIGLLWALKERRAFAWVVAGLVFGAAAGIGVALVEAAPMGFAAVTGLVLGAALFVIVRWIAGVRRG